MRLNLIPIVSVLVLVAGSWSAGRAQSRASSFELSIDAPRGELKISCVRGCDWPLSPGTSLPTETFNCSSDRCRWQMNERGRITVGIPN